jgi:predicted nucleic acid-binding protein
MNIIVDTNILFSFFWKRSITYSLLINQNIEYFAPEFALEEINAHKTDIITKTGLTLGEFEAKRRDLAIAVSFVPLEDYSSHLKHALKHCPDTNDVDFFALAIKLKLSFWSNDSILKKQNKVKVYSTSDLLRLLEFKEAFLE